MFTKRQLLAILAVLLLGLLLFARPINQTVAQEEDPGPASGSLTLTTGDPALVPALIPGGPGFYAQNGLAFKPYPSGTTPIAFSGPWVYNPDTATHYYEAPVSLPHGAIITKFVVWGFDSHATYDFWATLAKLSQDNTEIYNIASVASTGTTATARSFQDTTLVSPEVDLQSYTYWVEIGMPPSGSVQIISFRIDYSFPSYAPVIIKAP